MTLSETQAPSIVSFPHPWGADMVPRGPSCACVHVSVVLVVDSLSYPLFPPIPALAVCEFSATLGHLVACWLSQRT